MTLQELLDKTEYVVEATDLERMHLHLLTAKDSIRKTKDNTRDWETLSQGFMVCIKTFGGFPVNVSLTWAVIDKTLVMFYDGCSMVVHHGLIDEWVKTNVPKPKCNAMNFHNCLAYIDEKSK